MILLVLAILQDRIEMRGFEASYLIHRPASYDEAKSWPTVVQLEPRGGKSADGIQRWRDRGWIVLVPERREVGRDREAGFVRACLADAKSKLRVDPERVLLAGRDEGADFAGWLALADPADFAGCAAFGLSRAPEAQGKAPPFLVVLGRTGDLARRGREAASSLVELGVDVVALAARDAEGREEGAALEWFGSKVKPLGDLDALDRFIGARRWLDASLVSLGLLDRDELERFVRVRLRRIESEGIVVLGSVETAMGSGKYLDAWIRCRDAAVQFSWVPVGERFRKRLGELEADPRVRRARGEED
ncbi:MAG TPA: hypothetical protein VEN81_09140 [Planctomycetota bacterium]|nr:hypothetical protein [Planctomycetota bacterium]